MNKRPKSICSIVECGKVVEGRGLCKNHYESMRRKRGLLDGPISKNRTDTRERLKERFDQKWKLDEASGCWVWTGTRHTPSGLYSYQSGEMIVLGRKHRAHRISWSVHRGEIAEGMHVLHKCDNSLCVNPDHLYLGTNDDNMRDMSVRQRTHYRKITNEQALEIRASKESAYALYKSGKYPVGYDGIKRIKNGRVKRHV